MNQERRIVKIKRKYGVNAFRVWGKRGGSPILKAWAKAHPHRNR